MKKFIGIVDNHERISFEAQNFFQACEKLAARQQEGQFENIYGILLEDLANPPAIDRAYRLMAEGEIRSAMEELEREFLLRPAHLECAIADLISRARA